MRRTVLLLSLALLAGCGGSDTTSPPPPAPPPAPPAPPGPPASVTAQAGDAQTAAPNAAVPVRPSVVVRDASSRPVPSVTVTFAVDTGGGRIDGASAVSGSDGVATAGDWTLGPAEGANRLKATVGALAPARFSAEARYPSVTLLDANVPAGGGTLTYQKAGDPLDGLSLRIPAGAYATGGQWRVESRPIASAPSRPGLKPAVPLISVTTTQGMSDSLLRLTIPIRVAADSVPAAILFNEATGRYEGLPTLSWTPTSLTVAARHFNPALMLGPRVAAPAPAPGVMASALSAATAQVMVNMVSSSPATAMLAYSQGGVTTDFEPTNDMWEFGNFGSYITLNGQSTGNSLSAIYFFLVRKLDSLGTAKQGLGLFGLYPKWAYWAGNPLGYRLAAQTLLDVNWPATIAAIKEIDAAAISAGTNPDVAHYFALLAAMAITRRPQILITNSAPGIPSFTALVAYKVTTTEIWAADPSNPGQTIKIPFQNGNFGNVQLSHVTGAPTYATNRFRFAGQGALIQWSTLAARWAELDAGKVTGSFPAYSVEYWDDDLGIWKDFPVGDTLTVAWLDVKLRARCITCAKHIAGSDPGLSALDVFDRAGTRIATDRTLGEVKFRMPVADNQIGVHIMGGQNVCAGCATFWGHVDFRILRITTSKFFVTPDPATGSTGTPVTLTARHLSTPTPSPVRYDWSFTHFGSTQTVQVPGDSVVQHTWPVAGSFTATVTVRDANSGKVLGRASAPVNIGQALPIWRFTAMNEVVTGTTFPNQIHLPGFVNMDIIILMEGIWSVPRTGLLFYYATPVTVNGLSLAAGVYVTGNVTGEQFNTARFAPLARPVQGPYVDGFGDELVIDAATAAGDLSSGTFGGKSATRTLDLTAFRGVGGKHTVSHWEVTATKSGMQLTGKITYYLEQWGLDMTSCIPVASLNCTSVFGGTLKWEFPFTAVRVR